MTERGAEAQIDIRIGLGEPADARDKPFGSEVGRYADRENTGIVPGEDGIEPRGKAVEGIADKELAVLARLGEDQALMTPQE